MPQERIPDKVLEWIPVGRRKRETSRKIQIADINEAMVVKGLGELDLTDRENWRQY